MAHTNPPSEEIEQRKLVNYMRLKGLVFTSMTNENQGSFMNRQATIKIEQKAKAMGKQKGYPDIIIDEPNRNYHGLRIELKRQKKQLKTKASIAHTKVSDEQTAWINKLNSKGYYAVVCYGADEAIEVIDGYMGNQL